MIDLLVLAFVAFSAWRGRKRGLIKEMPGAVGITVFAVTGWGIFKIMFQGLSHASEWAGYSIGVFSFFLLLAGSVFLWRRMRGHLRGAAARWPGERQQRIGGVVTGGLRAFVFASTVLLILAHWPLHKLTRWMVEGSFLGRRLVRCVLPVYERTHGAL